MREYTSPTGCIESSLVDEPTIAILFGVGLKMMEGRVSDPYKKLRAQRKSQSEQAETLKSSRRIKRKKRSDEI